MTSLPEVLPTPVDDANMGAVPVASGRASARTTEAVAIRSDLACHLLFVEALEATYQASYGTGPSTELHRRLWLADKWRQMGRRILADDRLIVEERRQIDVSAANFLTHLDTVLNWLISETFAAVPEAGEEGRRRDNEYFTDARRQAYYLRQQLTSELEKNREFQILRSDSKRWPILGFKDESAFFEHLVPTLRTLACSPNPMPRDLFRRLLDSSDFGLADLASEGYPKDIIMDSVNALLKEKLAQWTHHDRGALTLVGKRLLAALLAEADSVRRTP